MTNPYKQPLANLLQTARSDATLNLFRYIVLTNLVLYVFWFFVLPVLEGHWLADDSIELLGYNGYAPQFLMPLWALYVLAACWIAISIGLFFLQRWARTYLVWLTCVMLLLSPLMGMSVSTGTSSAVVSVMAYLDGATIVMAYLTSVATHFNHGGNADRQPRA